MRINRFIAQASGLSRRAADQAISDGRVRVNGKPAQTGYDTQSTDVISLDGKPLAQQTTRTILLNKPVGYVVSRDGQGARTIYELLPKDLHGLKPVGRLDKDSSGLILLTNDGALANQLTHPSQQKEKIYEASLDKALAWDDRTAIEKGVKLDDGPSALRLDPLDPQGRIWRVTMTEGRNRQIRRTFEALGYKVTKLHRTQFGNYALGKLDPGMHQDG